MFYVPLIQPLLSRQNLVFENEIHHVKMNVAMVRRNAYCKSYLLQLCSVDTLLFNNL